VAAVCTCQAVSGRFIYARFCLYHYLHFATITHSSCITLHSPFHAYREDGLLNSVEVLDRRANKWLTSVALLGGRWCKCSCDVHLCSLHSAHANLTINMQLYTRQLHAQDTRCASSAATPTHLWLSRRRLLQRRQLRPTRLRRQRRRRIRRLRRR
jgi:hypothetical protein